MNKLFIYLIEFYRKFISPMMASRCRFYPTCSEYALPFYLTLYRLVRCQPFCKAGVDPLPIPQKK